MYDTTTIGILAGVVSLAAFVPYVISILKGRTKPNRATWIIFSVTAVITLASYSVAVHGNAIWVARGYVVTTIFVALLSAKYGVWSPGKFDLWALGGCAATLGLWALSGSAELALFAILATEAIGLLPTIKKTRRNPEQEDSFAWILSYAASFLTLLIVLVDGPSILNVAYPVYLTVSSGVIAVLSFQKKHALSS